MTTEIMTSTNTTMDEISEGIFIYHGDCLDLLKQMPDKSVDFVYTDPPFNTGNTQSLKAGSYEDNFTHFMLFIKPILVQLERVTKPDAVINLHFDQREVHYVKVWADQIFGRDKFMGEIIWHFETGSAAKKWWSNKHNTILQYGTKKSTYNIDAVSTTERKAPKPGYEDSKRWASVWNINMSTTDPQRTGYPTQKPEALVSELVAVHTHEGDLCLDPFAGSGTLGAVAKKLGRKALLIDNNIQAIEVMEKRLADE